MGAMDGLGAGMAGFTQGLTQSLELIGRQQTLQQQQEHMKQQNKLLQARQTLLDEQINQRKTNAAMGVKLQEALIGGAPKGGQGPMGVDEYPGAPPNPQAAMGIASQMYPQEFSKHLFDQAFPKPQAPINVAPGGTLVSPQGQPIFSAPPAPERPVSVAPGGTLVRPSSGEPIYTAPQTQTEKASDWEVRQRPDGSMVRVHKATGQMMPVEGAGAVKTAQPRTAEDTAAAYAGVPEGQRPSKEQADAMADYLAKRAGKSAEERTIGGLTDEVIQRRTKQAEAIQGVMVKTAQSKAYNAALGKFKAELAEDDTGTSYGAALQEARASGKPLTGTAATDIVKYNQYLRASNALRKEFSDQEILKYVGYGRFQAKQLEQFIQTDPRFMRFMVLNEQLRGTAFGEGGKQLTPFEASVVFGYTPTGREAWGEYYLAKLDEIGPRFEMLMKETLGAAKTPRGKYTPSQMPKAPTDTGGGTDIKSLREKYGY